MEHVNVMGASLRHVNILRIVKMKHEKHNNMKYNFIYIVNMEHNFIYFQKF